MMVIVKSTVVTVHSGHVLGLKCVRCLLVIHLTYGSPIPSPSPPCMLDHVRVETKLAVPAELSVWNRVTSH